MGEGPKFNSNFEIYTVHAPRESEKIYSSHNKAFHKESVPSRFENGLREEIRVSGLGFYCDVLSQILYVQ